MKGLEVKVERVIRIAVVLWGYWEKENLIHNSGFWPRWHMITNWMVEISWSTTLQFWANKSVDTLVNLGAKGSEDLGNLGALVNDLLE